MRISQVCTPRSRPRGRVMDVLCAALETVSYTCWWPCCATARSMLPAVDKQCSWRGKNLGSCVATVRHMVQWRHDRLPNHRIVGRQHLHALAGAVPIPRRPEMSALWQHSAAAVPSPRPFPWLPMPRLRGLLHPPDRHGLRENPAATGHSRAAATRDCQGRADRPPGTRVGSVTETAAYLAASSPGQSERHGPHGDDGWHHLRGGRTIPERGGKKAPRISIPPIRHVDARISAKGTVPMPTIVPQL